MFIYIDGQDEFRESGVLESWALLAWIINIDAQDLQD